MIKLNGKTVEIGNFPDGTILMKQAPKDIVGCNAHIEWKYENDRELVALIYLTKHLRRFDFNRIDLCMPYIPNARQDRVKSLEDIFTLKYFAEIINDLHFDSVTVLDPHSSVSEALINNLRIVTPKHYIEEVINELVPYDGADAPLMFYPDEGAMKRYSSMSNLPYTFGIKKRDWKTGKIEGLHIAGSVEQIAGKDILIVDDICSRGGTFYYSAKKLKEHGANDIYLYVSHCENTILEGDLLKGDLIKKVYTTDSIFTKSHEKIEVLK